MPSALLAAISWDNVTQNDGIPIAITGIVIVFVALVLITLFLYQLPRLVEIANGIFPEPEDSHAAVAQAAPAASASNDDEFIAAAIAVAHHTHQNS